MIMNPLKVDARSADDAPNCMSDTFIFEQSVAFANNIFFE